MGDAGGVDKKRRYDRQLRIWGEAGQARLEGAHVCLLTCGPTGTEALKNLVLGGIAAFTLVDGAKVTPADLGNKCVRRCRGCSTTQHAHSHVPPPLSAQLPGGRLGAGHVPGGVRGCAAEGAERQCGGLLRGGGARAAAGLAPRLLQELHARHRHAGAWRLPHNVAATPAHPAGLCACVQLPEEALVALDTACREYNVPLVAARSYGLVGSLRVSVKVRPLWCEGERTLSPPCLTAPAPLPGTRSTRWWSPSPTAPPTTCV